MGSTVTLSIVSTVFPIDGDYKIRWSQTATFEDEGCLVLAEGNIPRGGYDLTTSFTVPEAKYGINYVQFMRLARDEPVNIQFSVKPSLRVEPSSAIPGSVVTVKGSGFPADDTATLTFDGETTDLAIETSETGSFAVEFTVPDTIAGSHKFVAEAPRLYTENATATLKIGPYIRLEPELPEIGTEVTVAGCGFAASSPIHIKYDNLDIANSPSTDETGCFSYKFNIPESSKKDHTITVSDEAGNTATFTLPLEGKPPPKPVTVSPKDQRFGWFGAEPVTFNWTEVSDPSGITYTLEIGDNLNFFPLKPGMRRSELTQNSCTIYIEPGTYYWRVKATDGAGNEGEWVISPYPFRVGFFSIWAFIGGGLIVILILLFLVRSFFRRLSEYYH